MPPIDASEVIVEVVLIAMVAPALVALYLTLRGRMAPPHRRARPVRQTRVGA